MRTLIYNAKIYPMTGPVLDLGYLIMRDSKVEGLGEMSGCPGLASGFDQVLDARGGYLLPGLVDAHTHIGIFNECMPFEEDDTNESTDPVLPQLRTVDAVHPQDRAFQDALRAGVTTVVVGPGSANPIGGQMLAMKCRGRRVDDMLLKDYAAMKLAFGENPKRTYNEKDRAPATRMATAAAIREALLKAEEYRDKQKADEDVELDVKCEALLPLLERQVPAQIHCHRADDIFTALRIAKEFQIQCVLVHCTEGYQIAQELAREQVPVIVGPLITTRTKPELAGLSITNTAKLAAAGLTVAICTDYPEIPQEHLMLSAALAAREGLSDEQAFAMVTANPAKIMGLSDRVGSLAPGLDGDAVLYDGHPFDTRTRVVRVWVDGEPVE